MPYTYFMAKQRSTVHLPVSFIDSLNIPLHGNSISVSIIELGSRYRMLLDEYRKEVKEKFNNKEIIFFANYSMITSFDEGAIKFRLLDVLQQAPLAAFQDAKLERPVLIKKVKELNLPEMCVLVDLIETIQAKELLR